MTDAHKLFDEVWQKPNNNFQVKQQETVWLIGYQTLKKVTWPWPPFGIVSHQLANIWHNSISTIIRHRYHSDIFSNFSFSRYQGEPIPDILLTRSSAIADCRGTTREGWNLVNCCTNNANRSRVSLMSTFSSHGHFLFCNLQFCTRIVMRSSLIAQRARNVPCHILHWLRVPERIKFQLCVLAFRCLHGTAPRYLA